MTTITGNSKFKPVCLRTYLPPCSACGGLHPLAFDPPFPDDHCPACGALAAPIEDAGEAQAVLTGSGTSFWVAKVFLWLADKFNRFAKGLI